MKLEEWGIRKNKIGGSIRKKHVLLPSSETTGETSLSFESKSANVDSTSRTDDRIVG
jgi:hypothetical protein